MPFFAAGPGIKAGTYSTVPVVGYDLLSPFADLAGAPEKLPKGVEGGTVKPVLFNGGEGDIKRPRPGMHFFRKADSAYIRGDHKIRRTNDTGQVELYNLANDLSETRDLAAANPRLAKRMQAELEDWIEEIDATTPSPLDRRARRRP